MGRQSVESKIVEEVSCLNDAVREKEGKPFDIKVSRSTYLKQGLT